MGRLGPKCIVEVGAGRGHLSKALIERGLPVRATDPNPADGWAEAMTAQQALEQYAPDAAIACWPPLDAGVEMCVLRFPSVRWFVYIGQLINGQIGPPQMWDVAGWRWELLEDLLQFSLCRWDYFSPVRQEIVRHSYPFLFTRVEACGRGRGEG